MKSIFKKSAISLLILGMAGSTYAAMPTSNTMWSPGLTGAFIGVDALDLRPMNGDLDYVTAFPTTTGGSFSSRGLSTDYDWSWRLYGGIKFTDHDDITLSWMRMRASDKDSVSILSGALSTPRWLFFDDWDTISAKVDFDLDQFYAVWGHTINFNNPWSVRYAAGVEWVRLDSDMTITAEDFDAPTDGVIGFTGESHLRGWGPRVEFDMTYHLPYNFALFANANAALLVSNRKISLIGQDSDTELGIDLTSSSFSTRHVVIPKFGMRLGASYSFVFGQAGAEGGSCTSLTLDAGWQVESYIHAIERPDFGFFGGVGVAPVQGSGFFASTKTSNFGDQGLFLGAKLNFDWL